MDVITLGFLYISVGLVLASYAKRKGVTWEDEIPITDYTFIVFTWPILILAVPLTILEWLIGILAGKSDGN